MERASVDEAYLDITETVEEKVKCLNEKVSLDDLKNTFVIGSSTKDFLENLYEDQNFNMGDLKLAIGGVITENLRAEVYKQTGTLCVYALELLYQVPKEHSNSIFFCFFFLRL